MADADLRATLKAIDQRFTPGPPNRRFESLCDEGVRSLGDLADVLATGSPERVALAACALVMLGASDWTERVLAALGRPECLRSADASALVLAAGSLGVAAHPTALVEGFVTLLAAQPGDDVVVAILSVLCLLPTRSLLRDATGLLALAMGRAATATDEADVRSYAIALLAQWTELPAVREHLERLTRDPDPAVRREATRALLEGPELR